MAKKRKMKAANLTASLNNSLSYKGNIVVKTVNKKTDKVIKVQKLKNNGRWPLFEFFARCLEGKWQDANNLRPYYIDLFSAGQAGANIPNISDTSGSDSIGTYANATYRTSLLTYPLYTSRDVTVQKSNVGYAEITLTFLIPFTAIIRDKDSNLICLYSNDTHGEGGFDNPSAFFFVPDSNDPKKLGKLIANKSQGDDSNDYNLIIEWTMSISNNISNNGSL